MSDKKFGVLYADWSRGQAVTESGIKFEFTPCCSLHELLVAGYKHEHISRVFLVGELPSASSYKQWLIAPEMYKYWRTQKIGHMLQGNRQDDYVARYEHKVDGRTLDVRSVVRWLGEGEYTIYQARSAMLLISAQIRAEQKVFPFFQYLAGTPATTFSVLWKQYNQANHRTFEPLPENIRNLIHGTTGQGRIEYFDENCGGRASQLYYYDGIFMYAALANELPTEVLAHDTQNIYAGKQYARYRIAFRVPDFWQHVGPFGVMFNDGTWRYPGRFYRGQYFETWVEGSEVDALEQVYSTLFAGRSAWMDWDILIKERIVYKTRKESAVANPLDSVVKKLGQIRDKLEEDGREDIKHATVYRLARAGIRNMVLHGIGAFHRQGGSRTYIAVPGEPRPAGFTDRDELDDGRIVYILPDREGKGNLDFPQFPATVWGRCRARMFKSLMLCDPDDVVTVRTDAIATKKRMPMWDSNKEIGKLRLKWAVEKPLKMPPSSSQFDDLQHKIVKAGAK